MDFITDLPISNGFDSIFIVVNQGLSKGVILCPCNKTIDAEGTIKLYIDNVFIQYGLPDIIISDRGPQFASNVFNGIFNAIGVKHRMSTTYHPQTDGQTERYNQELEAYLRIYCIYKPDEWSNKLSLAQFAHNARTHEAIKQRTLQDKGSTRTSNIPINPSKTMENS
jgi:transposase InsO family protein